MGFEDNKEALGFEGDQIDLDSDADLSMGTGRTKAQRKKGIKTEEVAFSKPRRDRFGRRSDGEEAGVGADMLNPDKPTRIAGGFSRREMTPQEVKPLQSENSKFGYLFSADEEDEDEVSTVQGKAAAVEALSMKGDEADAGNIFERETRSVIHSQGKPQRRTETPEASEQRASGSSRFSRRGENSAQPEKPAASRFSRRSQTKEASPEPVKEEPVIEVVPTIEEMTPPVQETYPEPAAEDIYADQSSAEQEAASAVYADNQMYGYANPYMYGQYPPPYSPYGGYPPQSPYGQPYGQQQYPYGYPPAYPQPQYIPVGYMFQAGFVPVEMTHGNQQRRRRPSAARSAHRYDRAPELPYEEQAAKEAPRVRAISAKSEPIPEPVPEPIPEPKPEPIVQPEPPAAYTEPARVYESQYDRIAAEIPEEPVMQDDFEIKTESSAPSRFSRRSSAAQSAEMDKPTESAAPSRFARRGSSENAGTSAQPTEGATTSRFAARGSASRPAQSFSEDISASSAPSGGGRFNRRG